MKFLKVAVMSAVALAWSSAYAFHSGGVAECEGCHSMHNSFEGETMVTGTSYGDGSGPYLLKANDQSGACLNCHEGPILSGYHVSTSDAGVLLDAAKAPTNMTPGGDFSWLKLTTNFTVRKEWQTGFGERRGHNIVAGDFGYVADPKLTQAPGGTYPADKLACSSCHDPHGRYRRFADGSVAKTGLPIWNSGSYNNSADPVAARNAVGVYRILGGVGYQPKSLVGSYAFANQVPAAVAPSNYNRQETSQPESTFVAYGSGMSEWCANCHTAFLSNGYTSGMPGLRHPAGNSAKLKDFIVTNYNAYVTSGIMTNIDVNKAYSTLAAFEVGGNDYTALKAKANLTGAVDRTAATTANVACVSCHRVHAGGFESMLRFFYLNEFMTVTASKTDFTPAYDGTDGLNGTEGKIHLGLTKGQTQRAYYERPATEFGAYARLRCNKCHAKD